jgi:hypothetical protein
MLAALAGAPSISSVTWKGFPLTQAQENAMPKHYRVVPPLEGLQPASSFLNRIYTEIPAAKPEHPICFEGEWVCSHTPCPVRTIRLRVKAFFHQHLPRLRCPLCLRMLDFHHWLEIIDLQEVPVKKSASKARRPSRGKESSACPRKRKASPETGLTKSS